MTVTSEPLAKDTEEEGKKDKEGEGDEEKLKDDKEGDVTAPPSEPEDPNKAKRAACEVGCCVQTTIDICRNISQLKSSRLKVSFFSDHPQVKFT